MAFMISSLLIMMLRQSGYASAATPDSKSGIGRALDYDLHLRQYRGSAAGLLSADRFKKSQRYFHFSCVKCWPQSSKAQPGAAYFMVAVKALLP
jgi:hypothetical protein